MVGKWTGVQSNEWEPTHSVEVTFAADGRYHAKCQEPYCVSFYWGTDLDFPGKEWKLENVEPDGTAGGQLWIVHGPDRSRQIGKLAGVSLSENQRYLQFEFLGPDVSSTLCFGPTTEHRSGILSFRLERVSP